MRYATMVFAIVFCSVPARPDTPPQIPPTPLCGDSTPGVLPCQASKSDLKSAKDAFARGLKLQNAKKLDEAFAEFEEAARVVPHNLDYLTAREMLRQQLVFDHITKGNDDLVAGRQIEALAEFRSAIQLDPENTFAQQRLQDAAGGATPKVRSPFRTIASASGVDVSPLDSLNTIHYRGDSRGLLTQVASSYGVTVTFDDSVPSRNVRFDIGNVNFGTAMQAAGSVTKTFFTPIGAKEILIAADTPENHRVFDRMGYRTFAVPGATTPQEITEIVNVMRGLFDIRFVMQQPQRGTITLRAPMPILDAATRFLEGLDSGRPEVLLDISAYEVSHTYLRQIGVHIPNQFKLFNIPLGALAGLGGQNIQDLINQLISSGGINQANNTSISALLAQLQSQQNSLLSQPLATFGGGITLFGLSLDQLAATLSLNESSVRNLEHVTLRASDGRDASFKVGSRFPILNATFAPIFNSAAISQVIQNQSFTPAFPSFNYEDIGLTMKVKPDVHTSNDVSMNLELQLRTLTGTSINGVPVISNREYKGSIALKEGEPAVVAGMISRQDQHSLTGLPFVSRVPGLNQLSATNEKQENDNELLIVITPHVVREAENNGKEIWLR
ncbi:MAG TPA: type II and III secretion system protein [Terriglobales bacterium]|jgi:general secretion pathway protein D|nr:type II and III secretion system protein [Terriglobales bacterium]